MHITLYLAVLGISIIQMNKIIKLNEKLSKKKVKINILYVNGYSDNDYKVATLFKSYLTVTGINMQILKNGMAILTSPNLLKALTIPNGRTDLP